MKVDQLGAPKFDLKTFVPSVEGMDRYVNRPDAGMFVVISPTNTDQKYLAFIVACSDSYNEQYLLVEANDTDPDKKKFIRGKLGFKRFFTRGARTFLLDTNVERSSFCITEVDPRKLPAHCLVNLTDAFDYESDYEDYLLDNAMLKAAGEGYYDG